ncbi:MAG: glycoside hydrolase family 16 protein [Bacteroidota bacterium]
MACLVLWVLFSACEQSDPLPKEFSFSGYHWRTKAGGTSKLGPGPNYFSDSKENVWLDQDNYLHLRITKSGNQWNCAEVVSTEKFQYGTYVFTVAGGLNTMNERAVFGLFTWSDYTFQQEANSEVDVEFARWGNASDSKLLTYSVQPVWFDNPTPYQERTRRPALPASALDSTTTHVFTWTPDTIFWYSYSGENYPGNQLLSSWKFDKGNTPRAKMEGGSVSDSIVIPAPSNTTNVRFNLWLLNGLAPANNSETEVVIKRFEFRPI